MKFPWRGSVSLSLDQGRMFPIYFTGLGSLFQFSVGAEGCASLVK